MKYNDRRHIRVIKEEQVLAYRFNGVRYDCGSKAGYLEATSGWVCVMQSAGKIPRLAGIDVRQGEG